MTARILTSLPARDTEAFFARPEDLPVQGNAPATAADVAALSAKLDRVLLALEGINRRQAMIDDLVNEMMPVAKLAMGVANDRLQAFDEKGWFAFIRELVAVVDRIVETYGAAGVRDLGDNVVDILDTVKNLTQADILATANVAAETVHGAGEIEPKGVLGILKATNDEDVRRGLGVALELLRRVGQASQGRRGPRRSGERSAQEKLAAVLGPSRKALPAPRAAAPRPSAPRQTPPRPPQARRPATAPPMTGGFSAPNLGVPLTADGFFADASTWSPERAESMAIACGVALTARHWDVLNYARSEYLASGASPNVRKVAVGSGVPMREIYTLFPNKPGMTTARIAGIPKPVGCV
jgi:TusE/DsrC/DsvC family sulfur relay protein